MSHPNTATHGIEIDFNPDADRAKLTPAELSSLEARVAEDIRAEAQRRLTHNMSDSPLVFYAIMVLKSNVRVGYGAPTAYVMLDQSGLPVITINPFYWQKLKSGRERFDVCVHELLHPLLYHFQRFPRPRDQYERHLQNIAMDTAANQLMTWRQEKDHHNGVMKVLNYHTFMTLLSPGHPKIETRQTAEYYYRALKKYGDEEKLKAMQYDISGQGILVEDHDKSRDEEADSVQSELFKEQVRRAMSQAGVSGNELGLNMKENDLVDWKSVTKRWLEQQVRGSIRRTKNRPNKRVGYAAPRRIVKRTTAIDCMPDTSGSMGSVLDKVFGSMLSLCNETVDFTLYAVDTELTEVGKIRNKNDLRNAKFPQGGGTCFETAIPKLESRRERRPVIMFTDTYGAWPEHEPSYPILIMTTDPKRYDHMPAWAVRNSVDISSLLDIGDI